MGNNKKNNESYIRGRWWTIKNNIKKNIPAKYDKIKDWHMDPKGYFLIKIDKKLNQIRVGYCKFSKSAKDPIVTGTKAGPLSAVPIIPAGVPNGAVSL